MQSIAGKVSRHDMVLDVGFDNVCNGFVDFQERNLFDQTQSFIFLREVTILQLIHDGFTGRKIKTRSMIVPPFARPASRANISGSMRTSW
jgi:hypothetical protein